MGWFSKKTKSCPHDEDGNCARCMVGDQEHGLVFYVPLDEELVIECVAKLPEYINDRMREWGPHLILAGGFIRDTLLGVTPKDVDLFTQENLAATLSSNYSGREQSRGAYNVPEVAGNSRFAPTTSFYQFIYRFQFSGPEDLLDQFDYSITRAAIWYDHQDKAWQGTCWDTWYRDIASKRLVFLDRRMEPEAILRLLKFTARGYSIDTASLGRVLTSMVGSVPSGLGVDLDKLEIDFTETLEKLSPKTQVNSQPYKKPKRVATDWGDS